MRPGAHRLTPKRASDQNAGRQLLLELDQLPYLLIGFYLSLWSRHYRHLH